MKLNIVPKGGTRKERFLRMIGMLVIFALVGWAFWYNNQSTLEKLQGRNALWDQTKVLNNTERNYIKGFVRSMRSEFGVVTKVHIMNERITEISPEPKEMFIGLAPEYNQAVFHFPSLVRLALGPNFIRDIEQKHFTGKFENDKWPEALQAALAMIWGKLIRVEDTVHPIPVEESPGQTYDPESSSNKE
jgi:hypothetical protein